MLSHCNGHPLAIVVLGGVLATKITLEEWQNVSDNLDSNLQGDGYIGVYEKDYHLWIAEGIISSTQDQDRGKRQSLEDIAKVYLNELVQRGMVQVVSRGSDGDIEMCKLHDLMRDKCLEIGKGENFLQTVDDSTLVDDPEQQQGAPS